jgi:Zn-dependent M16 (insulinase) family peptidase
LARNVHRSTVVLLPDASWLARRDEAETRRLESVRARMTTEELERIVDETATLARMQVAPDSTEALATVPVLDLKDLDRAIRTIPTELDVHPDATVLWHGLTTRGIVYLDIAFDMHALPARYVPYMGLFGSVLLEMGTEALDFVQLTQRIGCKTGGIGATAINTVRWDTRSGVSQFVLRSKCTTPRHGDLLAILLDVLLSARLDDRDRFRQIVLEERADVESDVVPHGNAFAGQRLRAGMNSADWVSEQTGGISYLFFLRRLLDRIDNDWQGVLGDLEHLRASLINRAAMTVNITADEADRRLLAEPVRQFICALPESNPGQGIDWPAGFSPENEGLCVPSQVNFVAKGADLYALGHSLRGAWLVIQNWLSTTYLWERVRVRGGAYGGSCRLDPLSGIFAFSSYRDPNLAETVDVYDGTGAFLRSQPPDQSDVKRSIIGVIGGLDRYLLPDAKGYTAFIHHLSGMTDDVRQTIRGEVLQTDVDDFLRFADVLDDVSKNGSVVAVGSAGAIQRANSVRGDKWLSMTRVL